MVTVIYILLALCFIVPVYLIQIYIEKQIKFDKQTLYDLTQKEIQETKVKLDELMFAEAKMNKLKKGSQVDISVTSEVVDIFYFKDEQYGLLLPVVKEKYIDFPGIVKIEDTKYEVLTKVVEDDMLKTTALLYVKFKKKNKDKFFSAEK